ncbi:MAG: L-glyceraldehyde 3-phosphate reductase, partial [Bacteroidetes bacterium]
MTYIASENRYETMKYNRCGKWGLKLPAVSLGLWHNFGDIDTIENGRAMLRRAFDLGITHFDLANNYGPPPGSAEENFGKILKQDFAAYRDELIISTKAGYLMWPGPYGEWGSRKYLVASLDQSLKRMGLDYVDIFYHHRPDPDTPIEESMGALDQIVRSGKALYAGISNYRPKEARLAIKILNQLGTPCLIHQPNYNMFDRWIE